MTYPENVEFAAITQANPTQTPAALRNAPAWVFEEINQRSVARGQKPPTWVFEEINKRAAERGQAPPFPKLAAAPRAIVAATQRATSPRAPLADPLKGDWFFAACCPGISFPDYCQKDRRLLRERFSKKALEKIVADFEANTYDIELRTGHKGIAIASTATKSLRFELHKGQLMLYADFSKFPTSPAGAACKRIALAGGDHRPRGLAVSVTYNKYTTSYEKRGAETIRVVESCDLKHVAIVDKGGYEHARGFWTGDLAFQRITKKRALDAAEYGAYEASRPWK